MEEDTSQTKSNPDLNNHGAQSSSSSRCPPHHLSLDGPGGGGCLASTSDEKKKQEAEGRLGVCNGEVDSLLSIDETDSLPKKLNYTCFDLFCTLVSILTYVADLVMDIVVAVYFYHLGVNHGIYHYWYFGLTVTFILLPSLTMTGFSFRWYLQDADDAQLPPVPLWRWILRLIVLMLQIAPVLRYFLSSIIFSTNLESFRCFKCVFFFKVY